MVAFAANAQTITDELRRDQQGQGKVIVNQSEEIERLINNIQPETKRKPAEVTRPADSKPVVQEHAVTPKPTPAPTTKPVTHQSTSTDVAETPAVNTNKKIMRRSYKATGYRIQVFSGGNKREDRTKCERISAQLKSRFPDQPIYVHFYSPSWKCRIGNFTDKAEAQALLSQIKAMGYTQACLVKGTINVQY